METLRRWPGARSCAAWDASPSQGVTEVRFSAVRQMTPARSEIILQTHDTELLFPANKIEPSDL